MSWLTAWYSLAPLKTHKGGTLVPPPPHPSPTPVCFGDKWAQPTRKAPHHLHHHDDESWLESWLESGEASAKGAWLTSSHSLPLTLFTWLDVSRYIPGLIPFPTLVLSHDIFLLILSVPLISLRGTFLSTPRSHSPDVYLFPEVGLIPRSLIYSKLSSAVPHLHFFPGVDDGQASLGGEGCLQAHGPLFTAWRLVLLSWERCDEQRFTTSPQTLKTSVWSGLGERLEKMDSIWRKGYLVSPLKRVNLSTVAFKLCVHTDDCVCSGCVGE